MVRVSVALIHLYRRLAPATLRDACLFEPTCSEYAILALRKHGVLRGWPLAIRRIHRCRQPGGGIDYP